MVTQRHLYIFLFYGDFFKEIMHGKLRKRLC